MGFNPVLFILISIVIFLATIICVIYSIVKLRRGRKRKKKKKRRKESGRKNTREEFHQSTSSVHNHIRIGEDMNPDIIPDGKPNISIIIKLMKI